jgi:cytochrome c-type biogenesis protein CcmH
MTRRDLLRRAAMAAAGIAASRRAAAQTPAPRPDSVAGDPLFRPDAVQERAVVTERDNDPVVKAIEQRLKCTCGCNLDIYVCRTTDFTCQYSPALHREVLDLRDAGKSPDEVVAAFVAKHGEQILMAPPPEGFNLAGYLVPGAAVALAAATIGWILVRRGKTMAPAAAPASSGATAAPPALSAAEQDTLRRALDDVQD